jgi:hypothetical protein
VTFDLSQFNWTLIIIIAVISAVVSWVGDVLGKKIGKKRISLMGLRPRYTSTVITILTGVGVAMLTLICGVVFSDSMKAAMFGANLMARRMTELNNEVRATQDELDEITIDLLGAQSELSSVKEEKSAAEESLAELRRETEDLKHGLAEMKEGRVVVFQGEMLAQTALEKGAEGYDTGAAFDVLLALSKEYVARKIDETWKAGSEAPPDVVINDEMRESVGRELGRADGRKVLRLTAPSNIVLGQTLECVVSIFDSDLIYKEGEVLMRETLRGSAIHEDAANVLYTMLKRINRSAVSKGILPDPYSGTVGNLDSLDFYDIVDQIVENGDERTVTVLAARDIYTEGPVYVKIEVKPGGSGADNES